MSKIVAEGNKELVDKLTELAPLIIIGLLWLFGAIAKSVAGGKKGAQTPHQEPKAKPKQPDFAEFIKSIKEQYTQAKEQAKKQAEDDVYRPQPPQRPAQPARPGPAMAQPPRPQYKSVAAPQQARMVSKPYTAPPMEAVMQEIEKPLTELSIEDITKKKLSKPVHVVESHPYLAQLADQFAHTDGLRKAILNQEILGKPLALRD